MSYMKIIINEYNRYIFRQHKLCTFLNELNRNTYTTKKTYIMYYTKIFNMLANDYNTNTIINYKYRVKHIIISGCYLLSNINENTPAGYINIVKPLIIQFRQLTNTNILDYNYNCNCNCQELKQAFIKTLQLYRLDLNIFKKMFKGIWGI